MYVYVNENNEIKSVDIPVDGLTGYYISEKTSPFKGWSSAKICCYKVNVKDGIVMMMTPYVDSRMIEHFDQLGVVGQTNSEDIVMTMDGLADTYESMEKNTGDIDVCLEGIAEIYEILFANSEENDRIINDMFE